MSNRKLSLEKTSNDYEELSIACLQDLSASEIATLLESPVIQALRYYILANYASQFEQWQSGVFTAESADGTFSKNSQAIGRVEVLDDVLSWMSTIVEQMKEESIDA